MSKNKGYVWLMVIVVIAVVLAIVLGNGSNGTENDTATTTEEAQITEEAIDKGTQSSNNTGTTGGTQATQLPLMTANGAYIIYYYSTGFSPSKLTIKAGKSVRFINSSSNAMLITPVDKVNRPYSSLQQSKSVGKGGTFDYTFSTTGSYAYYNDNKDAHTGVINVTQ
ncbi:MAG: hypothetical protein AAB590_02095 [Patescibacteria group bacterium]